MKLENDYMQISSIRRTYQDKKKLNENNFPLTTTTGIYKPLVNIQEKI